MIRSRSLRKWPPLTPDDHSLSYAHIIPLNNPAMRLRPTNAASPKFVALWTSSLPTDGLNATLAPLGKSAPLRETVHNAPSPALERLPTNLPRRNAAADPL